MVSDSEAYDPVLKAAYVDNEVSTRYLLPVLNRIDDALLILTPSSTIVYANAAAEKLLGTAKGVLIGSDLRTHVATLEAPLAATIRAAIETPTLAFFECRLSCGWIACDAFPSGQGTALFLRDISIRKEAEEQLRISQVRLRELEGILLHSQRMAHVGSWTVELKDDTLTVEPLDLTEEMRGILGYARQSEGESAHSLLISIHPDDRHEFTARLTHALQALDAFSIVHRIVRPNGTIREVRQWVSVTASATPGTKRIIGTCQDITDLQANERALAEANRKKDEFLATLAHELRNPLAPIRTGAELLNRADLDSAKRRWAQSVILRQVGQLSRIVDDLLDVARVTLGRFELNRSVVSLRSVVDLAVETSRPGMLHAQHTFSVEMPTHELYVDVDHTRICQVVYNLLNNASKYTPAGGTISLIVKEEQNFVSIAVRDNGLGIKRDMLSRVFELFAQMDPESRSAQGGLGIGLTLAKRITEMHGGSIEACSSGLGSGSTFTIRLPIARLDSPRDVPENPVAFVEPIRILVVDDNKDACEMLALALQDLGHVVEMAFDGRGCLDAIVRFQPRVALVDIGMPDMSGLEVAERIKGSLVQAGVILIALTGWGQESDRSRSHAAGFDYHLTKPVELRDIEALLIEISHSSDQRRE